MNFAINHMSVKNMPFSGLLDAALQLGCAGVEIRNDLSQELFDGDSAKHAGRLIASSGLQVFALAEVKAFNHFTDETRSSAIELMQLAADCGAPGVALIPRCDGHGTEQSERISQLRHAITELKPLLAEHELLGFIEPLGFEQSSLRSKSEAIDVIGQCNANNHFRLVHDTFHHYLAGGGPVFPAMTAMIHVSGVVEQGLALNEIRDEHRVLVDQHDRLQTISQLRGFHKEGYSGPVSMEAFSAEVHNYENPVARLRESFDFIAAAVYD